MKIAEHNVRLVQITPHAEELIESMGRLCYKSENQMTEGSAIGFIEMLKRRGHLSVLEHAIASFIIGTDRGVTHELVRHRIASYSQTSTRYCNYSKEKFGAEITVVKPVGLVNPDQEFQWLRSCVTAEYAYLEMLKTGASPQLARSVLPTCLYTEIGMTANFREWLHFLDLRTSPQAHPDMWVVAGLIQTELQRACPTLFLQVQRGN